MTQFELDDGGERARELRRRWNGYRQIRGLLRRYHFTRHDDGAIEMHSGNELTEEEIRERVLMEGM